MPLYAPATQPRPVRTEFDPVRPTQQVSAIDQRPVERENLAQKLRDIVAAGSGKYYRIQFVKRTNGALRDMLARWPIKPFEGKTGNHRNWNPDDYGLVQAQEGDGKYRLIPINNVLRIRGEGRELRKQNNQRLLEPEDRKYAKDYVRRPYYTPGEGPNDERPKGMTQNYAESLRQMVAFAFPVGRGTPFAPPTSPWQGGQYAPKGYREKLLSSMNMVPVFLPSGQTQPAVGITPTGGTVPPPKNTAMIGTPQRAAGAPQMPKRQFSLREEAQSFGIRSIPPTASTYLDRLRQWRTPGSDVEPPDMPARERISNKMNSLSNLATQMSSRRLRVSHGGLDYDPSEMSDRDPSEAEKREIVGPNVWDTRMSRIPSNLPRHVREMLGQYELERSGAKDLERHSLRYPNYPAQEESRVNVPGSGIDVRTNLLEKELNDPSVAQDSDMRLYEILNSEHGIRNLVPMSDLANQLDIGGGGPPTSRVMNSIGRRISQSNARHNFARSSQQFKLGEDSHEEVMRKMPTAIHRTGLRHLIGDRAVIPQGNSLEQLQQRMAGRADEAPVQRAADRRAPRQRSEPDIAGMMSVPQSDLPEVRVQMPGSAPIRHARGVHDLTAMDPEKMRNILQSRMTKGAQRPQYIGQREHENLRTAISRVLDQYGQGNEPIVVPDDGQEFKAAPAPGRGDPLLERFNRMAQQRHGVNGRNRIAGYLGGDVVAGDLPGNVRVGQPPLPDAPTQPQDVPSEPMNAQSAPQMQGRSRLRDSVVSAIAKRGSALPNAYAPNGRSGEQTLGRVEMNPQSDKDLVRDAIGEDERGSAPFDPSQYRGTRGAQRRSALAQITAERRAANRPVVRGSNVERPKERTWSDWWNGLNNSVERGFRNLGQSATRSAARGTGKLFDMIYKALDARYGQPDPVTPTHTAKNSEPIPLSPQQASTWISEANKRAGQQPFTRALEHASRAENYRPGGRRFELDEMSPMPQQNFGLREMVGAVNPINNYKNLRKGGFGRLASGAMVGGGLVGDAALTGFHPPMVSLALGRYAQGAAKRNQPERDRAEWMQG